MRTSPFVWKFVWRPIALFAFLVILVLPIQAAWASAGNSPEPLVSLQLQGAPVVDVVQALVAKTNRSVVFPEDQQAKVSVQLHQTPMKEAMDLIATLCDLELREVAGVWVMASAEYWQARDQRQARSTEVWVLVHRDAIEALELIKPFLSDRGEALVDVQTNRLWITDRPLPMEKVQAMMELIDRPAQQVLIESRIVIANRDFNKALGLSFGVTKKDPDNPSGLVESAQTRLGVGANTSALNFSLLSTRYQLDAELSALEASGKGRVISTPRIMVTNRAEAFIQQGVAVPFEAVQGGDGANTGAVSVQFREAALALRATPLILSDGRIQMDLEITQDTVGQIFQTGRGGSVPSIDTRQLGTRVWVNDGQTLVLGGIFQEQDAQLMATVPGLSKIPGLGRLFQRESLDDQRRELLVFITPIIQQ